MRYLSVCSGIEAATLAWHPLGWEPVAFSEIDAFPSAVLKHHYPNVPNWGDMTKFQEWPDACRCVDAGDSWAGRQSRSGSAEGRPSERGADPERRPWRDWSGSGGDYTSGGTCATCGGTAFDLLVGGTPCQSFSVAGLRKGLDDPRGNLMLVYLALARRYRPRWLVWENVPGVLSSDDGRAFGSLLGGLAELGYGFAYRVLDAQYFGLAQRRQRVFVVGCLGDWRRAAAVLFERESLSGHPAPRREAGQGATPILEAGARTGRSTTDLRAGIGIGEPGDPMFTLQAGKQHAVADLAPTVPARRTGGGGLGTDFDCDGGLIAADIAPTLKAHFGSKQGLENQHIDGGCGLFVAHSLRGEGFDASEDGTGRGTPLVPIGFYQNEGSHDISENRDIAPPLKGGQLSGRAAVAHAFDARQSDVLQYGDQAGPLDTDGHSIAVAFRTNQTSAQGPIHSIELTDTLARDHPPAVTQHMAVRRLTPKECCRLQGFPDDYLDILYRGKPAADGNKYKALGNSMAVPCMAWIGKRIQMVEQIAKEQAA